MKIERSYDIRDEAGRIICPDFECLIDCELEWDNGVPVVRVDDVLARDWRTPFDAPEYFSLYFDGKHPISNLLGNIVAEFASNDPGVLDGLLEQELAA